MCDGRRVASRTGITRALSTQSYMDRRSQTPIWPFLLIVGFLFLLCVIAPREWERIARERPVHLADNSATARGPREPASTPLDASDEPFVMGEPADTILDAEPIASLPTETAPTADVAAETAPGFDRSAPASAEAAPEATVEPQAMDADGIPQLAELRPTPVADEPTPSIVHEPAQQAGPEAPEPEPDPEPQPQATLTAQPRTVILDEPAEAAPARPTKRPAHRAIRSAVGAARRFAAPPGDLGLRMRLRRLVDAGRGFAARAV